MVEVKEFSRLRAESITSLSLFSAAATWAWRKIRALPIWVANRSVGDGNVGFEGAFGLDIAVSLFGVEMTGDGSQLL